MAKNVGNLTTFVLMVFALSFDSAALCGCSTTADGVSASNSQGSSIEGSGVFKADNRNVPPFQAVVLGTSGNVLVRAGLSQQSVIVGFDDNLTELVKTSVEKGTLTISSDKSYNSKSKLKVLIHVQNLKSMTIAGAGDVDIENLKGKTFKAEISGAGNVTAKGSADSAAAVITGAGNVHFKELKAKDVSVRITGSGNADVNASRLLDATITGSGSVKYTGNPTNVKRNITGSGSVSPE